MTSSACRKWTPRFVTWVGCLFALLTPFGLRVAASSPGGKAPGVQPGEIALRLTLLTKDGAITAGEPLLARVELQNRAGRSLALWLGNSVVPSTHIAISDRAQGLLAATPRPEVPKAVK